MRAPRAKTLAAILGIAALTLTALTGCGSSNKSNGGGSTGGGAGTSAAAPSGGGTYEIGLTGDFSAGYAALAVPWRDGILAYFDAVNKAGGINGNKVNVTALDDGNTPTNAAANVHRFISAKDSAVFVYSSTTAVTVGPLLSDAKIPASILAPTLDQLEPVQPYLFTITAPLASLGKPMLDTVVSIGKEKGIASPKVGILTGQSPVLAALNDAAVQAAKDAGVTVVENQKLPTTATTSDAQALALASKKPDVVVLAASNNLAISAVGVLRQQGFTGPIIAYPGAGSLPTMKQLNDANYYVLNTSPYSQAGTTPTIDKFIADVQAYGKDPNSPNMINGYAQGMVMGKALEACGYPCTGEKLQAAMSGLSNLDLDGLLFGPIDYSQNHAGCTLGQVFVWDPDKQVLNKVGDPTEIPLS
ncbi:MAG: ABC transporter substrate-binding protein [Actinomycetia bacterium]|nr:ABC transporter substrate-binding protein [Actinomycetes bacterium]